MGRSPKPTATTAMSDTPSTPPTDENFLIAERRAKLAELRRQGIAFPNDFRREHYAGDLQARFEDREAWSTEALDAKAERVAVAGRILLKRVMGKASFVQVQDESGRILAGDLEGLHQGNAAGAERAERARKTRNLRAVNDEIGRAHV